MTSHDDTCCIHLFCLLVDQLGQVISLGACHGNMYLHAHTCLVSVVERKEKTTLIGVNLMRSQVLCYAGLPSSVWHGLSDCNVQLLQQHALLRRKQGSAAEGT